MHWRVSFVPNSILCAACTFALGILLGSSVRAEILKCVNDAGHLAFVNTGACPEGYSQSEATSEASTFRPPVVTLGQGTPRAAGPDRPTRTTTELLEDMEARIRESRRRGVVAKEFTEKSKWTDEGRGSTPEKVWNLMKAALLRGDTEGAVRCFSPFTRDQYRETFQSLGTDARVMAQQMKDLIPREKNDFTASYWLPKDAKIDGKMQPLVFSVTFVRGGDGVWLIERF